MYLGGTLPLVSFANDQGDRAEFLPCNPEKQGLYPDFLGYLKFYLHGSHTETKVGLNVKGGEITWHTTSEATRRFAKEDFLALIGEGIRYAERAGFTFPSYFRLKKSPPTLHII